MVKRRRSAKVRYFGAKSFKIQAPKNVLAKWLSEAVLDEKNVKGDRGNVSVP